MWEYDVNDEFVYSIFQYVNTYIHMYRNVYRVYTHIFVVVWLFAWNLFTIFKRSLSRTLCVVVLEISLIFTHTRIGVYVNIIYNCLAN